MGALGGQASLGSGTASGLNRDMGPWDLGAMGP